MSKVKKEFFEIIKRTINYNIQYEKKMSAILLEKYNQIEMKDIFLDISEFRKVLKEVFNMTTQYIKEINVTSLNFKRFVEIIEQIKNTVQNCDFDNYYNLYITQIALTRDYYIIETKVNYLASKVNIINNVLNMEIELEWMNQITYFNFEKKEIKEKMDKIDLEMQAIYDSI